MSQRWKTDDDGYLTGPAIEPKKSRADSEILYLILCKHKMIIDIDQVISVYVAE